MSGPRLPVGDRPLSDRMLAALAWCAVPIEERDAERKPKLAHIRALYERGLITHYSPNAPLTTAGVAEHRRHHETTGGAS